MDRDVLIFERGAPGRRCVAFPAAVDSGTAIPETMRRDVPPGLPEVSELELVRHYTALSQMNFSIDTHFYPLGSCTMKYNPRVHEKVARLPQIAGLHPLSDNAQPALQVIWEMEQVLKAVSGMDGFTFQPTAGAQGRICGDFTDRRLSQGKGQCQKSSANSRLSPWNKSGNRSNLWVCSTGN